MAKRQLSPYRQGQEDGREDFLAAGECTPHLCKSDDPNYKRGYRDIQDQLMAEAMYEMGQL